MSTTRTSDDRLDAALRSLDAAPDPVLDAAGRVRADAALERLLAEGQAPRGRAGRRDPLLPHPRRTGLRVAALGAAAAAAVVGVASTQVLGGAPTAYADSWEAVPEVASEADVAAAVEACAEPGGETARLLDGLQPHLVERRGAVVMVVLDDGAAAPTVMTCVAALGPHGEASVLGVSGGGGAVPPPAGAVTPPSLFEQSTPGDELAFINGLVGADVRAVTVRTGQGRTVQATVEDGHYAAWWPGRAVRWTDEVPADGGWKCGDGCTSRQPVDDFVLDVTTADGTVLRGVTPGS